MGLPLHWYEVYVVHKLFVRNLDGCWTGKSKPKQILDQTHVALLVMSSQGFVTFPAKTRFETRQRYARRANTIITRF
jgi:hypothetical protein